MPSTPTLTASWSPARCATSTSTCSSRWPPSRRDARRGGGGGGGRVVALPQLLGLALGLDPKELGMTKHVVKPTSVIDWSASVVAGGRPRRRRGGGPPAPRGRARRGG